MARLIQEHDEARARRRDAVRPPAATAAASRSTPATTACASPTLRSRRRTCRCRPIRRERPVRRAGTGWRAAPCVRRARSSTPCCPSCWSASTRASRTCPGCATTHGVDRRRQPAGRRRSRQQAPARRRSRARMRRARPRVRPRPGRRRRSRGAGRSRLPGVVDRLHALIGAGASRLPALQRRATTAPRRSRSPTCTSTAACRSTTPCALVKRRRSCVPYVSALRARYGEPD